MKPALFGVSSSAVTTVIELVVQFVTCATAARNRIPIRYRRGLWHEIIFTAELPALQGYRVLALRITVALNAYTGHGVKQIPVLAKSRHFYRYSRKVYFPPDNQKRRPAVGVAVKYKYLLLPKNDMKPSRAITVCSLSTVNFEVMVVAPTLPEHGITAPGGSV